MNQHHPKLDRQRNLTLRSRSSRVEPLGRSSLRSKGSSNSSEDKVKMFKNCVRKMIEFLFTQVGVGAVVVCFTIVGASIFQVFISYLFPRKGKTFHIHLWILKDLHLHPHTFPFPIFPCSIGFVECPWRIESFMKDTFLYLRLLKRKLKIPLLWKWRWLAIRRWRSYGTSPIPTILSIRGPGGEASIRLCPNINLQSCNSFSEALMDAPMLNGGHSPQL